MNKNTTKKLLNELTYQVIGAAIEVHKELGPGLLESVYHRCMAYELQLQKIAFQSQLSIPIKYKSLELDADLRYDFYIENCLVVELKTVDCILPVHQAQLFTYMRLLEIPKGILINFYVANLFKEGQITFVNELFRVLPEK